MASPVISEREIELVTEALRSGWVSSQGPYVERFEETFSSYCGARYGVAVSSGTAALHLALAVLGLGRGDEVIVPALSHIAAANAVTQVGAAPVLVDCDRSTWNLDPQQLAARISRRTKAIVVVHLYGHPADMDAVLEIASEHGLYVIEDAAESHGAEYKGRRTGSLGHLACFSFYANKIVTTGEGGMIVTRDPGIAERARHLRNQGYSGNSRVLHATLGFNYRLSSLQAALGLAQLERIEEFVAIRRENARRYAQLLGRVSGLVLPDEQPWAKSVYWMYSLLVQDSFGISRDELMAALQAGGIETRPCFYPVHWQPYYRDQFRDQSYPVAETVSRQGINLPSGNGLTPTMARRVADAILAAR
jgi:perosamine synthetase